MLYIYIEIRYLSQSSQIDTFIHSVTLLSTIDMTMKITLTTMITIYIGSIKNNK